MMINLFAFTAGSYKLIVTAELSNISRRKELFSQELLITEGQAEELSTKQSGLYFDWSSASQRYNPSIKHLERDDRFLTDC